jgi:hypothetical protein
LVDNTIAPSTSIDDLQQSVEIAILSIVWHKAATMMRKGGNHDVMNLKVSRSQQRQLTVDSFAKVSCSLFGQQLPLFCGGCQWYLHDISQLPFLESGQRQNGR